MHVPAQCAGKFFFRGTGLPTAVRKNQPLVPRSNFGGKVCVKTDPWFCGQTLPVRGHGGGGGTTSALSPRLTFHSFCKSRTFFLSFPPTHPFAYGADICVGPPTLGATIFLGEFIVRNPISSIFLQCRLIR